MAAPLFLFAQVAFATRKHVSGLFVRSCSQRGRT
jgi:hypothetical protein